MLPFREKGGFQDDWRKVLLKINRKIIRKGEVIMGVELIP